VTSSFKIPPLANQVVLLTGACGRIGTAVARVLANSGCSLVLLDRSEDALSKLDQELATNSITIECDICSENSLVQSIHKSVQAFGRIDALVHCAYPFTDKWGAKISDLEANHLFKNLEMQLGGTIILSKNIMEFFKAQGYGTMILLSSILGLAAPKFSHYADTTMHPPIEYSAIKAAMIAMTKWLSAYYANNQIRVNCISPGGILDSQPESFLHRYRDSCTNIGMLSSNDVAFAVKFLLSPESRAINGQNLIVDDGWSL